MEIQSDFRELLELFNANKVEYVIVGGYALAFHGAPRFTGDIDLFVSSDRDNAKRILEALKQFGFESMELSEEDFTCPDRVIQLGVPPLRIDIMTSLTGLSWQQVTSNKISSTYGRTQVYFIAKEDLISNKKALGRKKDLADIEGLNG
jgi:hypothetical protein